MYVHVRTFQNSIVRLMILVFYYTPLFIGNTIHHNQLLDHFPPKKNIFGISIPFFEITLSLVFERTCVPRYSTSVDTSLVISLYTREGFHSFSLLNTIRGSPVSLIHYAGFVILVSIANKSCFFFLQNCSA